MVTLQGHNDTEPQEAAGAPQPEYGAMRSGMGKNKCVTLSNILVGFPFPNTSTIQHGIRTRLTFLQGINYRDHVLSVG